MPAWNGEPRRGSDQGKEDLHVVLARIDERMANHIGNFATHRIDYEEHKKENQESFAKIWRSIYWASGGVSMVVLLINVFKH